MNPIPIKGDADALHRPHLFIDTSKRFDVGGDDGGHRSFRWKPRRDADVISLISPATALQADESQFGFSFALETSPSTHPKGHREPSSMPKHIRRK